MKKVKKSLLIFKPVLSWGSTPNFLNSDKISLNRIENAAIHLLRRSDKQFPCLIS